MPNGQFNCLNCGTNTLDTSSGTCSETPSTVPNCLIVSSDTTTCLTCNYGSFPFGGQCVNNPSGCDIYDGTKCLVCSFGNYFVNGSCYSSSNPLGCIAWDAQGLCASCFPGYYSGYNPGSSTTAAPYCVPCDSSCQACSGSATNCIPCPAGQYQLNGQCLLCNSTTPNCASCNANQTSSQPTCTSCMTGYHLTTSNTCASGNYYDADCLTGNGSYCSQCRDGYYSLSYCLPCFANCATCSGPLTCQTCAAGYTMPMYTTWCINITSQYNSTAVLISQTTKSALRLVGIAGLGYNFMIYLM